MMYWLIGGIVFVLIILGWLGYEIATMEEDDDQ